MSDRPEDPKELRSSSPAGKYSRNEGKGWCTNAALASRFGDEQIENEWMWMVSEKDKCSASKCHGKIPKQ